MKPLVTLFLIYLAPKTLYNLILDSFEFENWIQIDWIVQTWKPIVALFLTRLTAKTQYNLILDSLEQEY